MSWPQPRLYLVTDTGLCGGFDGVFSTVRAAVENGVDFVQLRDHNASTRELVRMAQRLIDIAHPFHVPVVVDDRLDVALAAGADGVHLGQSDLDPAAARRIAHAASTTEFHIGWSVTDPAQVAAARAVESGTIDLLGIGPFRATPTKPDAAAPLGLMGVGATARAAQGLSTVAIGGVKDADIADLIASGVGGVAVVSAICGQLDPAQATRELRSTVDQALATVGSLG